jgi:hypothetical protein
MTMHSRPLPLPLEILKKIEREASRALADGSIVSCKMALSYVKAVAKDTIEANKKENGNESRIISRLQSLRRR